MDKKWSRLSIIIGIILVLFNFVFHHFEIAGVYTLVPFFAISFIIIAFGVFSLYIPKFWLTIILSLITGIILTFVATVIWLSINIRGGIG